MSVRVSVLVVTYNSVSCIEACLDSVPRTTRSELEMIVIDNASSDGTAALVARRFPDARLAALDANLGFSAANNVGARMASGEHLLLLNNDTVVQPGAIDRMLDTVDSDPTIGVVGPRLIGADGEVQISFGHNIGFLSETYQRTLGSGQQRDWPLFKHYLEWRSRRPHAPDWVSGACLLVRRAIFEAVGGMDENFFMYTEEVDLCARIRSRGMRVVYNPTAEVLHVGGVSSLSNRRKTILEYRRSQLYFYLKHHGRGALTILKLYLTVKFATRLGALRLLRHLGRRSDDDAAEERLLGELLELVRRYRATSD